MSKAPFFPKSAHLELEQGLHQVSLLMRSALRQPVFQDESDCGVAEVEAILQVCLEKLECLSVHASAPKVSHKNSRL